MLQVEHFIAFVNDIYWAFAYFLFNKVGYSQYFSALYIYIYIYIYTIGKYLKRHVCTRSDSNRDIDAYYAIRVNGIMAGLLTRRRQDDNVQRSARSYFVRSDLDSKATSGRAAVRHTSMTNKPEGDIVHRTRCAVYVCVCCDTRSLRRRRPHARRLILLTTGNDWKTTEEAAAGRSNW